jgi:hypothetical protein
MKSRISGYDERKTFNYEQDDGGLDQCFKLQIVLPIATLLLCSYDSLCC